MNSLYCHDKNISIRLRADVRRLFIHKSERVWHKSGNSMFGYLTGTFVLKPHVSIETIRHGTNTRTDLYSPRTGLYSPRTDLYSPCTDLYSPVQYIEGE